MAETKRKIAARKKSPADNTLTVEEICKHSPEPALIINRQGKIMFHNSLSGELPGFESVTGKNLFRDFIPEKSMNALQRKLDKSIEGAPGKIYAGKYKSELKPENGKRISAELIFSPVKYKNRWHDIVTIRERKLEKKSRKEKSLEKELWDLRNENEILKHLEQQLRNTIKQKDVFFSILAHDLRAPFTSLLGLSQYLAEDMNTMKEDEISQFAEGINKAAATVYELLDNLLHWSRMQLGKVHYEPTYVNLDEMVTRLVNLYYHTAGKKSITLENNLDTGITVYADEPMLSAVLRNLISNAIKFTNTGGRVSVDARKANGCVELKIKDTGIGLLPGEIDQLFNFENHFSKAGTENEKGTGLGLIISSEFIKKNNGKLLVESEYGKGSTFIVKIPADKY